MAVNRRRYSYSLANAMRYMQIYDQLIDLFKSPISEARRITIKCSDVNLAPQTLSTQLIDGLKWIVEKFYDIPVEIKPNNSHRDYALLKLCVKSSTDYEKRTVSLHLKVTATTGIIVESLRDGKDGPERAIAAPTINNISPFRLELQDFLSDKNKTVFHTKKIILSDADSNWLTGVLQSPGLTHFRDAEKLTIVKEQN
jgi:hypothetical protein